MPPSRIACLWPSLAPSTSIDSSLDALADAATAFSPDIERGRDAVYLEVGDLRRLYPTEDSLATALKGATVEVSVSTAIAIAGDKGVARVAARGLALGKQLERPLIILAGRERHALSQLPIAALGPPPELLSRIALWGINTVGELAALPRPQVVTRLGAAGALVHRLACGDSNELLHKTPPSTELREEQPLLDAIDNLEPLLFVLRGLLDRLTARLRARSQACGNLTLRLSLSPRGEDVRQVTVAAPTQQIAPLLMLLRVALESQPPTGQIERLTLVTTPANPRPSQLDLFAPPGPAPEQLATTLARLEALCGSGRVGRPVVPDSYLPSAASISPFTLPKAAALAPANETRPESPIVTLSARAVRPPRPITVLRRDGAPCEVRLETTRGAGPCSVRRCGGPYRLRNAEVDVREVRDYYDVELQGGDLLRLFHDSAADRWFLDAVYD